MGTAHDNCCHCGGGFIFGTSGVDNPTSSPSPTAKPTIYAVSNDDPDHQFGACDDTPDWEDSFGDGCIWYETSDTPGCPTYGHDYAGSMGVAGDNCCYCILA